MKSQGRVVRRTKVMAFGTFDVLHPGHKNFLQQAKALAPVAYLIVSLARDVNVKRIKGFYPRHNEKLRLKNLKKSGWADRVILGSRRGYLTHILRHRPKIIALGYDQTAYTQGLARELKKRNLTVRVVRLKAYFPSRYKSSLLL